MTVGILSVGVSGSGETDFDLGSSDVICSGGSDCDLSYMVGMGTGGSDDSTCARGGTATT